MQTKGRSTKTTMEDILYPVNGFRGGQERKGIVPTDHRKKNTQLLKDKRHEFVSKQEKTAEAKKESEF